MSRRVRSLFLLLASVGLGAASYSSTAIGQESNPRPTPVGVEKPVPTDGPPGGEGRGSGGPADSKPYPVDLAPLPVPKLGPIAADSPATAPGKEKPVRPPVVVVERGYSPRPWHLAVTPVFLAQNLPAEEVSVDLELIDDPPTGKPFFFVPIQGHLNKVKFYFGLRCGGYAVSADGERKLVRSPGFVFTRWGTKDPRYVRPAKDGHYLASDHEGDIVSARARCTPARGMYTFTLRVIGRWADAAGPYVLVGGYVHCHATKTTDYVGAVRFDGKEMVLGGQLSSFVEVCEDWDDPTDQTDKLPGVRFALGNWRANGRDAAPVEVGAYYDEGVPQKARAFRWSDCPAPYAKGIDAALRRGRNVVVVVRGEDWPRDALKRDYDSSLDDLGQPYGRRRWEWLFEAERFEATYPPITSKRFEATYPTDTAEKK